MERAIAISQISSIQVGPGAMGQGLEPGTMGQGLEPIIII